MPIYEYACAACGHQFDTLQSLSEAPLTDCPECGQPQLTKLISAAGFRLKGGGWYETDFKSGGKKNLADSGKPAPAKADAPKAAKPKADAPAAPPAAKTAAAKPAP